MGGSHTLSESVRYSWIFGIKNNEKRDDRPNIDRLQKCSYCDIWNILRKLVATEKLGETWEKPIKWLQEEN